MTDKERESTGRDSGVRDSVASGIFTSQSNDSVALQFNHVSKIYTVAGGGDLVALSDVTFQIPKGNVVAIVGRSGSGKSTLLHLAAGIDLPTQGQIAIHGQDLSSLSELERTLLRRNRVGLVFQFFHLLPHLSVADNIALPELIAGSPGSSFRDRIHHLLDRVDLSRRAQENVDKLSGGEKQRVAICRALVRKPDLLLADEPTGNLDDESAQSVMDLFLQLAREEGSTVIFVTHSNEMAALAQETWTLHSGLLES